MKIIRVSKTNGFKSKGREPVSSMVALKLKVKTIDIDLGELSKCMYYFALMGRTT